MVNSDNVVRGGLTPKYKDTQTLVEVSIFYLIDFYFLDVEI
jgi:mannose-6-phosphate isomerase class I